MGEARRAGAVLAGALLSLCAAACSVTPEIAGNAPAPLCQAGDIRVFADFPSAGHHQCRIDEAGTVEITVRPEPTAGPPINPSPWFAFRLDAVSEADLELRFDYGAYRHRYHPYILAPAGDWQRLDDTLLTVAEDELSATLGLRVARGETLVAGQPLMDVHDAYQAMAELAAVHGLEHKIYGQSLEGRELVAYEKGDADAQRLIVAMTRQHPPELTGARAFMDFASALLERAPEAFWQDHRLVLIPVVNPDGVENGNWRLNEGGIDLNRDWFDLTQPETQAITRYLSAAAERRRTVGFFDFHSTWRTLIYSPPFENASPDAAALPRLQAAIEASDCPKAEWIFGHNSDRGTSKAWAMKTLKAPAITVEFGDDETQASIDCLSRLIAEVILDYSGPAASDGAAG